VVGDAWVVAVKGRQKIFGFSKKFLKKVKFYKKGSKESEYFCNIRKIFAIFTITQIKILGLIT